MILVALSACGATQTPVAPVIAPTAQQVNPANTIPAPVSYPTAEVTVATSGTPQAEKAVQAQAYPTPAPIAVRDLTPAGITVWNTEVGTSKQTGTCNNPPILPVYGLVQVTLTGDALGWKDQQAEFAMKKVSPSVWQYDGESKPVPGKLRLTVTFVDDKTLTILRELTPQSDPACVQTVAYKGVFQWTK